MAFERIRARIAEMIAPNPNPGGAPVAGVAHAAPVAPAVASQAAGFWEDFTWQKLGKLVSVLIVASAAYQVSTNDTPKNKHAESMAYTTYQIEQEKTQQILATAKASRGSAPQVEVSEQPTTSWTRPQTSNCALARLSQGSNWLNSGGCLTVGTTIGTATPLFGVGTESPIRAITGADFIIRTNDQSAECNSAETSDRCAGWIAANQTLGSDEGGGGKRRYWFWLTTKGNININA
jgi:hypothetical protein